MAVLINEWLPNPAGSDAAGEFVELINSGDRLVDIHDWILRTLGKKQVRMRGSIPPGGFLLLPRKDTRLVLRNADEGLALYDASGRLIDASKFIGVAPEGKSFSRITPKTSSQDESIQQFAWTEPTPGAANHAVALPVIAAFAGPFDVPVNHAAVCAAGFAGAMFGVAALLTALILYSIKANEDLSDIFFARDEAVGTAGGSRTT